MIWLTWRQQRLEALIGGAVLAALTALLVLTGLHIAGVYHDGNLAACSLGKSQPAACGDSVLRFGARFSNLVNLTNWFNMVPLLIGFWPRRRSCSSSSTARTDWPGRRRSPVAAGWQPA